MTLDNPYFGIARFNSENGNRYTRHKKYAPDRLHRISAYHLLERDLKVLFEYIDPNTQNDSSFSLRTYELFLRAATEFESNAKAILLANGYKKTGNLNMGDYRKLEKATKLSEYIVRLNCTSPERNFQPFQVWAGEDRVKWYQDYNDVKHDRSVNFEKANMANVIESVAAVFAILYAQFEDSAFDPYQDTESYFGFEDGFYSKDERLFAVKPYEGWGSEQLYNKDFNPEIEEYRKFDF